MGDIGDYWREHREYKANKGKPKVKPEPDYICSCGKKFYGFYKRNAILAHVKDAKGDHEVIKGDMTDYTKEFTI